MTTHDSAPLADYGRGRGGFVVRATIRPAWHPLVMGIFHDAARSLGSLRVLSDQELEDDREALRLRYVAGEADLYDELRRYDEEMNRRAQRDAPRGDDQSPFPKPSEHGWYLSEGD